jgi:sigma-B regulation protein RsbU (phosphoserine phosphatase)
MIANGSPRILVCASQPCTLAELRHLLAGVGRELVEHLIGAPDPDGANGCQLIVLEGSQAALDLCRRLRNRLDDRFVPILYLSEDGSPASRLASFEAGADTYLARPFAVGELLAQARSLLRIKDAHDRLAGKTVEVHRLNKRLQQLHQRIDRELGLARSIQASFSPPTLPVVPRCRFAVHSPRRERVGGDFYDVFHLDENHVGLYVADAMGHGVPASLLTVFVQKSMRLKDIFDRQYQLVPPEDVLRHLNKALLDRQLSEHPFLTIAYALYNHRQGTFHFARAGHPCPLHVPREGEPAFWRQEGLLLGVVDAVFPGRTYSVEPGDKVLLYSDGVEGGYFEDHLPGADSLLACAARHRRLPIGEFVDRLARDLFGVGAAPDDLTLLGLEVSI